MKDFNFAKTCIGSVPHTDASKITKEIISSFKEIPFWPQMPKASFFENMYVQYADGFPSIVVDEKNKKVFIDTKKDFFQELEYIIQKYLEGDIDFFSIKKNYALGLYEFLGQKREFSKKSNLKYVKGPTQSRSDCIGLSCKNLRFLKGHITGPVSFGLTVKDESEKSIIYIKELWELIPKFLGMKAKWQIKRLKEIYDRTIVFIDEPYLTSIGSSVVNIDKEKTRTAINEVSSMIREEGALSGLHCCGNTEWDTLLNLDIDILSFDAYNYLREFLLYAGAIKNFLDKERAIAWGIVPTNIDTLKKESGESLIKKLKEAIDNLKSKGIDEKKIYASSILTPSCGMGSLSIIECERVFALLEDVSAQLRI